MIASRRVIKKNKNDRLTASSFLVTLERLLFRNHRLIQEAMMVDRVDPLKKAIECFHARKERKQHPKGKFVEVFHVRIWQIDPKEHQTCCRIAKPNDLGGHEKFVNHWLSNHCRTIAHIANLYGVPEARLRKAIRSKLPPSGQQDLF